MEHLLKMQPGNVHDGIKPGETVHEYGLQDTNIPCRLDHTFNRNGRKWRVSSLCDTCSLLVPPSTPY